MKIVNFRKVKSVFNKSILLKSTLALALAMPGAIPGLGQFGFYSDQAIAAQPAAKKKTRKTPALREKVYSQLSRAQKLADDGKVAEGIQVLDQLQKRASTMNSYERAMMWNFYGFIYYDAEKTNKAIESFAKVVEIKNIPESLELSTLLSLAQLSMQQEKYSQSLQYIDRWSALKEGKETGKVRVLKANAYYAMKKYADALEAISSAVSDAEKAGKTPKENWLVLQRALHFELKQPAKVTQASEKLVRLYGKPKYWVELANMYGEINQTEKQLAVMEAAYQQGFVTKKNDFQTLAQLYFFNGTPYKAAKLLSEQLNEGVLDKDIKTLRFLAQAWTTAKEDEKAIPVLKQAADLSEDGNMDARLAEILLNLEKWDDAIKAARSAQNKGQLDNPGNINVALGMAYFNKKQFDKAIIEFKKAKKQKKVEKMANQWLQYVETEKRKQEAIEQSIASIGS
ncbi:MAG: hypothetical protein OQJ89_08480 [Kangiellaceae bacterium]|nr:hypothetical protein [Kangiellaceae bacterium]MCW9016985.1 hypothetical protein [Kangiellaceae bacterium]